MAKRSDLACDAWRETASDAVRSDCQTVRLSDCLSRTPSLQLASGICKHLQASLKQASVAYGVPGVMTIKAATNRLAGTWYQGFDRCTCSSRRRVTLSLVCASRMIITRWVCDCVVQPWHGKVEPLCSCDHIAYI